MITAIPIAKALKDPPVPRDLGVPQDQGEKKVTKVTRDAPALTVPEVRPDLRAPGDPKVFGVI
jgi:hypothetical protein